MIIFFSQGQPALYCIYVHNMINQTALFNHVYDALLDSNLNLLLCIAQMSHYVYYI